MYSWILVNKDSILECIKERQYIDTLSFKLPNFKTGNQTFLPQEIEEFKHIISEYNNVLDEYNYYTEGTNKNWVEFLYEIFAPILLSFAPITKQAGSKRRNGTNYSSVSAR